MKHSFRLPLIVCVAGLLGGACFSSRPENEMRPIGPDVTYDLLIYFRNDASHDQIDTIHKTVLSRPDPEGRGHYLAPGVGMLLAIGPVEGHAGFAINFLPSATIDQRRDLIQAVKKSVIVYRVLENTIPDNVKTPN